MSFSFPLIPEMDRSEPGILTSVFTTKECEKFIELCDTIESQKGTITSQNAVDESYRSSTVRWLPYPYVDKRFDEIYSKVQDIAIEINKNYLKYDIMGLGENIQYGVYEESDHYNWHMDVGPWQQSIRKFSLSILLNHPSEFEGGELMFKTGKGEYVRNLRLGDCCYFPSYFLHKVTPITKGTRKSLVVWITGPPYR
tara:strand:- start:159 stop:749 length:591 start_codon:yes stop_codon:yes gene_type:complete